MNRRAIVLAGLAGVVGLTCSVASAQSYNAFNVTDGIYGISVNHTGLAYTVSMSAGSYLMIGGNHYDITDIFGFWSVSGTNPLNGAGADQIQWNWNEHSTGGGYIAGWTNNSKSNDIQAGQQLTLTYSALDQSAVEGYGFHLSLVQNFNGGNTAFFRGPLNPVPEPATFACLGLGAIGLIRVKRKRKS